MTRSQNNPGLTWCAGTAAMAALLLIGVGGLVTSHEAGLAVPDWPTTYGYNMFTFPVSMWKGGILYEHTHRLFASGVGLCTLVLAGWLWLREERRWLRGLGLLAVAMVTGQGLLGGLRVTERMSQLGIFHAALAHLFLVVLSAITLFTSATWTDLLEKIDPRPCGRGLGRTFGFLTAVVFLQLLVAATMRHQHAGLAVPDFPTAYGRLWPETSPAAVAHYNQIRTEITAVHDITAFQITLHMMHRLLALVILGGVGWATWHTWRLLGEKHFLTKCALGWLGLVTTQIALGAVTVWTWRSPFITTLHVVAGAATLVAGSQLTLVAWRMSGPTHAPVRVSHRVRLSPRYQEERVPG
jgi:heme a synthase